MESARQLQLVFLCYDWILLLFALCHTSIFVLCFQGIRIGAWSSKSRVIIYHAWETLWARIWGSWYSKFGGAEALYSLKIFWRKSRKFLSNLKKGRTITWGDNRGWFCGKYVANLCEKSISWNVWTNVLYKVSRDGGV